MDYYGLIQLRLVVPHNQIYQSNLCWSSQSQLNQLLDNNRFLIETVMSAEAPAAFRILLLITLPAERSNSSLIYLYSHINDLFDVFLWGMNLRRFFGLTGRFWGSGGGFRDMCFSGCGGIFNHILEGVTAYFRPILAGRKIRVAVLQVFES